MTVAVSQKEAEKLLWGAPFGELSFALVDRGLEADQDRARNEPNLFQ